MTSHVEPSMGARRPPGLWPNSPGQFEVSPWGFVRSVILTHRMNTAGQGRYPEAFLSMELGSHYCATYLSAMPGFRARAKMNLKRLQ